MRKEMRTYTAFLTKETEKETTSSQKMEELYKEGGPVGGALQMLENGADFLLGPIGKFHAQFVVPCPPNNPRCYPVCFDRHLQLDEDLPSGWNQRIRNNECPAIAYIEEFPF
jgi:hypothetical protein